METPLSLLDRLRHQPTEADWKLLDQLYRPLIQRWLARDPDLRDEADDLVQDVLAVLVRQIAAFRHDRDGSFHRWLRTITIRRLQAHWRARKRRPKPLAEAGPESLLQLEDPASGLSQQWDREHDQHVARRLMELIQGDFAPTSWEAFRRTALDGCAPGQVAAALGLSVNAVLCAKSRVLNRLRQESQGLLDNA
jgi:RNA polymerase sigma-70 factor (ECF subfamily)